MMRMVFQGYSIYAALSCFILTTALAIGITDASIEALARWMINAAYFVFGPLLLTFVNYGFVHFKGMAFVCSPRGATHHINFTDIAILLFCLVMSLCITFTMAMQKTMDMAQQSFQDENSMVYQVTSWYFTYQVRMRQQQEREVLQERHDQRR